MEILPKDVYLHLASFADDKTIINMLSVNKKFNDPKFFEMVMKRKYPLLLKFRKNQDWKTFYLEMVKYISLLKEEHDLDYVSAPSFNPKHLYYSLRNNIYSKWYLYLPYITEIGDIQLFKKYEKYNSFIRSFELGAARSGNIELLKYIESKDTRKDTPFLDLMSNAVISRNKNMIDYVYNKMLHDYSDFFLLPDALIGAVRDANIELIKYYESKIGNEAGTFINAAAESGNLDVFEYFFNKPYGFDDLNIAVQTAAEYDHLNIIKFIMENSNLTPYRKSELAELIKMRAKNYRNKDIIDYINNLK